MDKDVISMLLRLFILLADLDDVTAATFNSSREFPYYTHGRTSKSPLFIQKHVEWKYSHIFIELYIVRWHQGVGEQT